MHVRQLTVKVPSQLMEVKGSERHGTTVSGV